MIIKEVSDEEYKIETYKRLYFHIGLFVVDFLLDNLAKNPCEIFNKSFLGSHFVAMGRGLKRAGVLGPSCAVSCLTGVLPNTAHGTTHKSCWAVPPMG